GPAPEPARRLPGPRRQWPSIALSDLALLSPPSVALPIVHANTHAGPLPSRRRDHLPPGRGSRRGHVPVGRGERLVDHPQSLLQFRVRDDERRREHEQVPLGVGVDASLPHGADRGVYAYAKWNLRSEEHTSE